MSTQSAARQRIDVHKMDGSAVINEIGYDELMEDLYIRFGPSNQIYRYRGVDKRTVYDFTHTDSRGKYFNKLIKGVYTAELIGDNYPEHRAGEITAYDIQVSGRI